jgi:diguanylate cyclase (GGDEF)-like protein
MAGERGAAGDTRNADARVDLDQTKADADQTQADADQTGSDTDQLASDADQDLADRDQHASDREQVAADWEQSRMPGGSPADLAFDRSRVERDAASRERESTATGRALITAQRLATAARRDEIARVRDLNAAARDRAAEARDMAAERRDRAAEERDRRAIAAGTQDAGIGERRALRAAAAAVREQTRAERLAAAADRAAAAVDRDRAAIDRRDAGLDELTGVFRRGTGHLALVHEIDRSRRLRQPLVLALADVDDLKSVNDSQGHSAGDELLTQVAAAITSTMRSYDVTVRWGGDEFVCALSNITRDVAAERVAEIKLGLQTRWPGATLSAGLAELEPDDTVESLVRRADAALYKAKLDRGR